MTVKYRKRLSYLRDMITVDFNENGKFTDLHLHSEIAKKSWHLMKNKRAGSSSYTTDLDIIDLFEVFDAIKEEIGLDLLAKEAEEEE